MINTAIQPCLGVVVVGKRLERLTGRGRQALKEERKLRLACEVGEMKL